MTRWRPLYTRERMAVFTFVFAVALMAVAAAFLVSVLAGNGVVQSVVGVVVACGLPALMALFVWRVGRVGVYVGDRGVRVQYLPNSDVVDWADVLRFVVRTTRRGRLLTAETEEIWVVRRNGAPVSTSIMRWVDPPPAKAWWLPTTMTCDTEEDFDQALHELEAALARSREAAAGSH